MMTWLCSCGSGAWAPETPRAVVCRYSVAITSLAFFYDLAAVAAHDRHLRSQVMDRLLTARPWACSICLRCHGSPSAHTVETDFGALNVTSIPPPRPPPAPSGRSQRPVLGCRPSIKAMKSAPSSGPSVSTPRFQVSASASHRPGAWAISPSGGEVVVLALGLHRLALQVARVPAASARTYARRSHHMSDDRQHPEAATQLHSARTPAAPPCMLSVRAFVRTFCCAVDGVSWHRETHRRRSCAGCYGVRSFVVVRATD